MQVQTLVYDKTQGWSDALDASLDSERTLVLAFAAQGYVDDCGPLRELAHRMPHSHILGCSTAGEIAGTRVRDESISVAVARFDHTRLRHAKARLTREADSFDAGLQLARALDAADLRSVFVLSTGVGVNGSELVRGINEVLGGRVSVTGGLAGDGARFQQTWVLTEAEPAFGVVAAVGLYGDKVRVGHGSKGGWDRFGPERVVTRSTGNCCTSSTGVPPFSSTRNTSASAPGACRQPRCCFRSPCVPRATAIAASFVRSSPSMNGRNR